MASDPSPATPSLAALADDAVLLDELRTAADATLARAWSHSHARAGLDTDGSAFDAALWNTVRELGWADLLVADDAGGGGAGAAELCTLAEALGAASAAVPLAEAAVAAQLMGGPTDTALTLYVEGSARLVTSPDGSVVHGAWPVVPFGAVADRFVIVGREQDGDAAVVVVEASQTERRDVTPLDRTPSIALRLDGVAVERGSIVSTGDRAREDQERVELIVVLARCAELVGVASAANAAAADYAKDRTTFGRPIGSYQAISHRLVDQRAAIEIARALVGRAARAVQHGGPDAAAAVGLAACWARDSLRGVTEGAIQVFGGIGYTWENDAHVHLRRAACLTAALGDKRAQRDAVTNWLVATHMGSS